jgi:ribosomal protein S18 acetylase RimI-like enzyme
VTISTVDVRDVPAALALLFGCEPSSSSPSIAHAFQTLSRGEWNTSDLFVAKSNDQIVGAIFAQNLPGSTSVIWPARTIDRTSDVEDELTSVALKHVAAAKVVQAFLGVDQLPSSVALERAGFERITQVLEMHRPAATKPLVNTSDWLRLVPFAESNADIFCRALWNAHEKSLDCPEIQAFRTPDELFDGYGDCARDRDYWWLAEHDGEPMGTLIMADRELIFVGVVPEHRGQGIGRALVAFACKKSPELSLIVDTRNAPAIQLYESMGFQAFGAREVFLNFQKV